MREVKSVELRCDDRAENLVFTRYEYKPTAMDHDPSIFYDYEINLEDSYCRTRCNRFVRAWKAFLGKPIYYSGIYTSDKRKVKKWLKDCLKLVNETDTVSKKNKMTELEAYKKFCLDLYTSWCKLHKENAKLRGIKTTDWLTKDIPLERIIEGKVELLMTGDIKTYWCESELEEDE